MISYEYIGAMQPKTDGASKTSYEYMGAVQPSFAPSSAKTITSFAINGIVGVLNESSKTIKISLQYGTDITALVAIFAATGASVKIGSTVQVSDTTANDFTNPVVYRVTAEDESYVDYTVTVSVGMAGVVLSNPQGADGTYELIYTPNKIIFDLEFEGTYADSVNNIVPREILPHTFLDNVHRIFGGFSLELDGREEPVSIQYITTQDMIDKMKTNGFTESDFYRESLDDPIITHHYANCFEKTTGGYNYYLFLDGNSITTDFISDTEIDNVIGSIFGEYVTGEIVWFDGVQVILGCLWKENFTPPTEPFNLGADNPTLQYNSGTVVNLTADGKITLDGGAVTIDVTVTLADLSTSRQVNEITIGTEKELQLGSGTPIPIAEDGIYILDDGDGNTINAAVTFSELPATDEGDVITVATLVSITVTPANSTITSGTQQQFTATGIYSNSSHRDITGLVTWESSDTDKATIATGGLADGIADGVTVITARLGAISGHTNLTIAFAVSIIVTPTTPTMLQYQSRQFTATANLTGGGTQDITALATWTSSDTDKAIVNSTGFVTAVASGTSTLTATYKTVAGGTVVTVSALIAIAVMPINKTVLLGNTQQYNATGTYANFSTLDITDLVAWSSSNTSKATIDNQGIATTLGAGSITITATLGDFSESATLIIALPMRQISILLSGLLDNKGNPLTGRKVYTYLAGTTIPVNFYLDVYGLVPVTNPIVLDTKGQAQCYSNIPFKLVIKDKDENSIDTLDNNECLIDQTQPIDFLQTGLHDTSGNALSKGTVDTYIAGTTTVKTCWTDSGKTVSAANPIILDIDGKSTIYCSGWYHFVVKDKNGIVINTWDNIFPGLST